MYRAVGMGNWVSDLMSGKLNLPPISMRVDLPGGMSLTPASAAASSAQSPTPNQAGVGSLPGWLIPVGMVSAGLWLLNRVRR